MKNIKDFENYCNEKIDNWKPQRLENSLTRDGNLISIPKFIFQINEQNFGDFEISWSGIDYRMYREFGWDYGTKDFTLINNFTGEKIKGICSDSKNDKKLEIENWDEFKTNAEISHKKWDEFLGLPAYGSRWTDTNYQVLKNSKDEQTKDKIFNKGIEYINKQ
jgi:hypothetical protein